MERASRPSQRAELRPARGGLLGEDFTNIQQVSCASFLTMSVNSDGSTQRGIGKRSISTDSFLREVTDEGLPRSYYGRTNRTPLNLGVCVGGVLGSLCVYGVLQERLMTIPYGGITTEPEIAEMFTSSVFLVLMNRLVTVCVSALGIVLTGDSFKITTPLNLYAAIAFANLVTTVCQVRVARFPNQAARVVAGCPPVHT